MFINPLIYAALAYPPGRVALVALWLLGLMNLGVWLGGQDHAVAYLFPTFGYCTFMAFTFAFVRLSRQQAAARRRADRLAGDLARQRDYLSQLVAITATLTRDLDLATVLSQVAAAGRALGHAAASQVQRIVQEALQNVEKHARASHVNVASAVEEGALRVAVRDDGAGFAAGQPPTNGQAGGFGLLSLRERARLAGGELQVASALGQGTLVALIIPLDGE